MKHNARSLAVNGEAHYPEFQSVVQDLQSKTLRYVGLLALADTATETEEWARYHNTATQMVSEDRRLQCIPGLNDWVAKLADFYRSEN